MNARDDARTCIVCGKPMHDGMTDLMDVYVHEGCFGKYLMGLDVPVRMNDSEGDDGGYYDIWDPDARMWVDTGIFWTEWE